MKVKARKVSAWTVTVRKMETAKLQSLCRQHANGRLQHISIDALFVILEELTHRREVSGRPFRSNEEAWSEFVQHNMPLTPSFHGKDCLGNGEHPGIECCCDECDFYLACFPDWRERT
jgi:hypothetical protein